MITVGALAKLYGQLPSYVQANATTYDIQIMDLMLSWEQQQHDEASGKKTKPKLSVEQMQSMVDSVKKKKNKNE